MAGVASLVVDSDTCIPLFNPFNLSTAKSGASKSPQLKTMAPKTFQLDQGSVPGRFPPVPVFLRSSSYKRSESPSLSATEPLVPKLDVVYDPKSGEKGEFAHLSVNCKQWRDGEAIPVPKGKTFYANPDPTCLKFIGQLVEQGALKKVEGAETFRHGDEVLELYEITVVESELDIVSAVEVEKCDVCGRKSAKGVTISKCSRCKKVGWVFRSEQAIGASVNELIYVNSHRSDTAVEIAK